MNRLLISTRQPLFSAYSLKSSSDHKSASQKKSLRQEIIQQFNKAAVFRELPSGKRFQQNDFVDALLSQPDPKQATLVFLACLQEVDLSQFNHQLYHAVKWFGGPTALEEVASLHKLSALFPHKEQSAEWSCLVRLILMQSVSAKKLLAFKQFLDRVVPEQALQMRTFHQVVNTSRYEYYRQDLSRSQWIERLLNQDKQLQDNGMDTAWLIPKVLEKQPRATALSDVIRMQAVLLSVKKHHPNFTCSEPQQRILVESWLNNSSLSKSLFVDLVYLAEKLWPNAVVPEEQQKQQVYQWLFSQGKDFFQKYDYCYVLDKFFQTSTAITQKHQQTSVALSETVFAILKQAKLHSTVGDCVRKLSLLTTVAQALLQVEGHSAPFSNGCSLRPLCPVENMPLWLEGSALHKIPPKKLQAMLLEDSQAPVMTVLKQSPSASLEVVWKKYCLLKTLLPQCESLMPIQEAASKLLALLNSPDFTNLFTLGSVYFSEVLTPESHQVKQVADILLEYLKEPESFPARVTTLLQLAHARPEIERTFEGRLSRPTDPEAFSAVLNALQSLPDAVSVAKAFQLFDQTSTLRYFEADSPTLRQDLKLLVRLPFPRLLLNYYLQHQEEISKQGFQALFRVIDTVNPALGLNALPELLSMIPFYKKQMNHRGLPEKGQLQYVSEGITRLYDYFHQYGIASVLGMALETWVDVATVGLSFSKWKYDAMRRCQGMGRLEQASLLEEAVDRSGKALFTKIPPRLDDATYQGGFVHFNKVTGLLIELRRAYIVISLPTVGTLVIRNSSPHFGRDLIDELAYFHPTASYTPKQLFDPAVDLHREIEGHSFQSILSPQLNSRGSVVRKNHGKMQKLMTVFHQVMGQYADWKCGFQQDSTPQGFLAYLKVLTEQAKTIQVNRPYAQYKTLRLAWVPPTGLPVPQPVLNVADPLVLKELNQLRQWFSLTEEKQKSFSLEAKCPKVFAFLSEGLTAGKELVLIE